MPPEPGGAARHGVARHASPLAEEISMKHGARNRITAKVTSIKKGDVMSQVKVEVTVPVEMSSVMTTESAEHLELAVGDEVELAVKAIHVLVIKR
jgi:molybdate transport system regulatory protein